MIGVIIHTCDKYSFIWDEFFIYFNNLKKELIDHGINIYFCNENIDYKLPNITQIKTNGTWSERLRKSLEQLPDKNIIYIQEDFLIKTYNWKLLYSGILYHEYLQLDITKFGNNYEHGTCYTLSDLHKLPLSIECYGNYIMSHQPISIFNKEFLLKTLDRSVDASTHELETTKRIKNGEFGNVRVICIGNKYSPDYSESIDYHHAIRKGNYVPYPTI